MLPIVLVLEKNVKANAACEPETPAEASFMNEVRTGCCFSKLCYTPRLTSQFVCKPICV
jgi:hypothetical protein